ncbi:MAG: hypothetical protein AVDCRST_MAG91-1273 [uncultured Sphingomonadaceae bacterium]|uniref:Aminotransferase class V domain-containing protein n=1 Tax=uncultured Sphingomonadaceae bacterium TaxID=169976 RepID=A0A6J4STU1_9SPHN|nr:MAG: hypothetical protein AVDCRST_MAG91-1273 [uncultured Sphingomonadaceae bacterium]
MRAVEHELVRHVASRSQALEHALPYAVPGPTVVPVVDREPLVAAMDGCIAHEHALGERLLVELAWIEGVTLYGRGDMDERIPTFAFTVFGHAPAAVARHLAMHGIFAWSRYFYSIETVAALGLADLGGLVRVRLCHYNSVKEVDAMLIALPKLPRLQPPTTSADY